MNDLSHLPSSLTTPDQDSDHPQDRQADRIALVAQALASEHFLFLPGASMRELLTASGPWAEFESFAASWDDLEVDGYMADRGRYRRRRHGVFEASADGCITELAPQPHFQTVDYNPLNGGIERWFAPLAPATARSPALRTILQLCSRLFTSSACAIEAAHKTGAGDPARWKIEVHQFRIETSSSSPGLPTPEGVHRDGVDHVLVLMIRRENIACGTTTIRSIDNRLLDSFTLADPLDAALLDDRLVYHGVTAVEPLDPALPAHRDVLVVTFKRDGA